MTTLEHLQSLIGECALTNDKIFMMYVNVFVPAGMVVVVVLAASDTDLPKVECASMAVGKAKSKKPTAAQLLYPDGHTHWTWVVMGMEGIEDSLTKLGD